MSEMSNNPVVIAVKPQDADQTADDDPGPSPYILIEYEKWAALDGVEALVACACEAAIAQEIVLASREVTVLLSSDEAVTELNASFRGKPRPTNVLSFPFSGHHYSDDPEPLGDIIIAYETVMREANDENKQPLDHLAHLTVHGLLHLAGYGHDTEEEAECMEALERIILADLDISDPYHIVEDDAPLPAQ